MAQAEMVIQGVEGATQAVVGVADAAAHIMDVARDEAAKCKEAARNDNNEFNIRKNFLDNAVNSIKTATCGQYNIVIATDQQKDDFQNLKGQILPMDLLDVEVSQGKIVNFEVYVFDTGNYLRHGKYEQDSWWYSGESKKWYDPMAMHVDFNNAQKKLDPTAIKKQQDDKAASDKTAADAAAAAKAQQDRASASNAAALHTDAAGKAQAAQATGGTAGSTPAPSAPAAPGFTDHLMSAAAGPMMSMFVGKAVAK
ncbi:hypothetical protein HO133_004955 [Letharia lupina]|uniref:Uncharacterized protein n=1 Tax=Letharia lupina TaxID=560253 RepID=A0A8H6C929_9LECA|nr:uncharacterized protein HO133_004955 [Letharia lupina]KAF6219130.1 hypothetical protein HO133_004955 [Letharia lupina]